MGLSIITPHFNNFEGVKRIYECLKAQHNPDWEWLIVDDFSDASEKAALVSFFEAISNENIKLILNDHKTNASVCRNLGIDNSDFNNLVFLDSDDSITNDFVANRQVKVNTFIVYKNYSIANERGELFSSSVPQSNPLDCFLKADFIWQTTCVLWNKSFLKHIGKFDTNLHRLQDVELSIRALFLDKDYRILDVEPDFIYNVKPIRSRVNFLVKVCDSVNYLISKINKDYHLDKKQHGLIKGYYYLCVKYLHRSKDRSQVKQVGKSLALFHSKKYISLINYLIGLHLLLLYRNSLISDSLFLRINRYLFK